MCRYKFILISYVKSNISWSIRMWKSGQKQTLRRRVQDIHQRCSAHRGNHKHGILPWNTYYYLGDLRTGNNGYGKFYLSSCLRLVYMMEIAETHSSRLPYSNWGALNVHFLIWPLNAAFTMYMSVPRLEALSLPRWRAPLLVWSCHWPSS